MFKINTVVDKNKATQMNPLVLAFIGDAVYSLYVREKLAFNSDLKVGGLNNISAKTVSAKAQAEYMQTLMPILTEEELAIYKRARNTKKGTRAKNANVQEYNTSTGFEAVVGYLYVIGETERLDFLLNYGDSNED